MQAVRPVDLALPPPAEPGLLAEIAAGLATSSDLNQLVARFLDRIVRLAGAQAGTVRLLSDAGDQLQLVSALGLPEGLCGRGTGVDRHCGHCGAAADGQQIVWATDLSGCSSRTGSDYFGHDGRLMLAVPLQHRGRLLGIYNLFFSDAKEPSPEIQDILRGELGADALDSEEVLFGEHLGRRHHRALPVGLDGPKERRERNDGLARADVALQQTLHRRRAG